MAKANVGEFIGLLFMSRDFAHKEHLNTDSYAEHVALGCFYDGIVDLADSFAEAWMGRNMKKVGNIPAYETPKGKCLDVLKRHLDVVEDIRDFVGNDSTLNNIIDEVVALYLSTIYKLKFLK